VVTPKYIKTYQKVTEVTSMVKTSEKLHEIRVWYMRWRSKKIERNDSKSWDDIVLELRDIITPEALDGQPGLMDVANRYINELERRNE
jgi:hypothetical protein